MATERELETIRNIFRNWPRYTNPENEKKIIALASVEPGGATAQNIGVVFNRLCSSGQLLVSKEHELEIVAEFLDNIPKYQECCEANKSGVVAVLHELKLPVTLEHIRHNFGRIEPRLGEDSGRSEGYRSLFGKYPDFAVEANKSILDAAHSYGEQITVESIEKYFSDPLIREKLIKTATARQADAEAQERQVLVAKIVDSFETFIDGRGRTVCMSAEGRTVVVYKDEVDRIKGLGLEELRRIRDGRAETERLRNLPTEELRQEAARGRQQFDRFEPLPDCYSPPGKPEVQIPWSLPLMKRLPSFEVRKLLRLYGPDAINAAIAARGK